MANNDFTKFIKRVNIKADTETIYDLCTTQQGLEKWFLRSAEFIMPDGNIRKRSSHAEAGDIYKWMWFGYCDDVVESEKIIQANGKDFFQFVFSGGCIMSVKVYPEEGETICELTQENFPEKEEDRLRLNFDCSNGWTFYLTNLKSILEGGIDLRNKNEKLVGVVTA